MVLNAESAMKIKLIDYGSTAVRGLVKLIPKNANRPLGTLAFYGTRVFIDILHLYISDQFSWRSWPIIY